MNKFIPIRSFGTSCKRNNDVFERSVRRYIDAVKINPPTWIPPSTFRPERLNPSDCVQELPHPFDSFYCRPEPKKALDSIGHQHKGASINWVQTAPPKHCRGFLYYHAPKNASTLAGAIRFRLTPHFVNDSSPRTAFATGSDLLIPDAGDLPWSVPVWSLSPAPLAPVRKVLRVDGYPVPAPSPKQLTRGCLTLHALGQPFLVEFHMHTVHVWFLSSYGGITRGRIQTGFVDLQNKQFRTPYTGFGIMTLDRLDDGTLVTRLEKILSLTQVYANENVPQPVEGMTRELHLAPILFKEGTKPAHPKYQGALKHLRSIVEHLPHASELGVRW